MRRIIRALFLSLAALVVVLVAAIIAHGGVDKAAAYGRAASSVQYVSVLPVITDEERERQAKLRAARHARMAAENDVMVWNGLAQDECMAAIGRAAKVPGSVQASPESWPVAREGKHWVVLANYTAKNVYGVTLRGRAACRLTQAGSGFELASLKVS